MALKFLNKKGWHTGSLRNIENVWKAEQKHDEEQKKLEEFRKQLAEERERAEFRLLQEQAGLVPRQERLEFLYESGLAVGKGSSSDAVFKALEPSDNNNNSIPPPPPPSSSAVTQQQPSAPGALFEEKPQSANDAWRKLHSDPLLLIRQREQESLARVKNNPVQMAIIRNSVEAKKGKEKVSKNKRHKENKSRKKKSKHHKHSSSAEEDERVNDRASKRSSKGNELSDKIDYVSEREERKKHRRDSSPSFEEEERSTYAKGISKSSKVDKLDYGSEREERDTRRRKHHHHHHRDSSPVEEEERSKYRRRNSDKDERSYKIDDSYEKDERRRNSDKDICRKQLSSATSSSKEEMRNLDKPKYDQASSSRVGTSSNVNSNVNHRRPHHRVSSSSSKLSAEERAARLKEMQLDAEVHEESRWKRIKKADEIDTMQEAAATMRNATSSNSSKNFLDAAKRSVYGAEKGGSATIEESVRRRTHYLQSKSEQGNAFRR